MTSSSEETRINVCRIGNNIYQGQTLQAKAFGYGTLFDEKYEQFIIGLFQENKLIDLQVAQFLKTSVCCDVKKFQDYHVFSCEKENFIAKISVLVNNINTSDSFDKIFNQLCSASKVLELFVDELSIKLDKFCNDLEDEWFSMSWSEMDDNKPLEFYNFYQILKQSTTSDGLELIKKLGNTPVIFGEMSHKRAAINNVIVKRNNSFKFSNIIFKVDLHKRLTSIMEKVCAKYRASLLERNCSLLKPHIEALEYPSLFLIRITDIPTLLKAIRIALHYHIPFDVVKVFQLINRPTDIKMAVPTIMKCYPGLLEAFGRELKLLSKEVKRPYETVFDVIVNNKPFEMECDTINYNLRRILLQFILELLIHYKPGDSVKKKLYSGPHEDYSVHSTALKSKTISFYETSFKGQLCEDIRIWYDMLDLTLATIYTYIRRTSKVIAVPFIQNFLAHFQFYSKKLFDIFKKVSRSERDEEEDCMYEFVILLTDIMLSLVKDLFEFTCDTAKSELIKGLLERPIDKNSNVLDQVKFLKAQVDDFCMKK